MRIKDPPVVQHLAFLSVKHNACILELFQSLVSAKEKGKAKCQELTFQYRGNVKNEAIFLVTKEDRVISQFRAPEEFLRRQNMSFENWIKTDKIRRQIGRQNPRPKESTSIQDLKHGMKRVNVLAKILETGAPTKVFTRYGNNATVTNAWVQDDTGKIKMCLWNEQTDSVNVGDTVKISNASVSTYKGEKQLHLGKNGTISVQQT
jgi:hypothetical protein